MDPNLFLTGQEFNKLNIGPLVTVINPDNYNLGLNINNIKLSDILGPKYLVQLYFFPFNFIMEYLGRLFLDYENMVLATVQIPDDAIILYYHFLYRTNKLIILDKYNFRDHPYWNNQELVIKTIYNNKGLTYPYIKNKTREINMAAIIKNSSLIKYMENIPENIGIIAVRDNPKNLGFISNQTENICLIALESDISVYNLIRINNPRINYIIQLIYNFLEYPNIFNLKKFYQSNFYPKNIFSGYNFNLKYTGPFLKILKSSLIHGNFKYNPGLNRDTNKFIPYGNNLQGGLYFSNYKDIFNSRVFGEYLCEIKIPEDALVYINQNKFKSDKIIIWDIYPIQDHPVWSQEKYYSKILNSYPMAFIHLKNKSEKICLEMARKWAYSLDYIPNLNPEICLAAVNKNGSVISHIPTKFLSPELFGLAISKYGRNLKYIEPENQTEDLCILALRRNLSSYKNIKIKTDKLDYLINLIKNFFRDPNLESYSELKKLTDKLYY